ncbi:hypothetical protein [Marinomonas lutimaris]|uniref:hypothetical protein n=1 Tax=Marinomonas lutimaris TaxID=2846746 RepID=UPI001CA5D616|nr:hypothetical protein [Marinomonas lutimaris]
MIKRALFIEHHYQKIFICFIFFLIVFRGSLAIVIGSSLIVNGLFLVGVISSFCLFIVRMFFSGLYRELFFIYLFVFWCFFLVCIYGLTATVGDYFVAIIGFINLCGLLLFYSLVYLCSRKRFALFLFIKKTILFVAIINAVGAIFQYYISVDLFGLISNAVYADSEKLSNVNVTKRAVSFISSPQSLSLFLAFAFVLVPSVTDKKNIQWVIYLLLFFSGLLTVSKAFVVFLIVYLLLCNFKLKRFGYFSALIVFLTLVFSFFSHEGQFSRVLQLIYLIENYEQYSAYIIWKESIFYVDDALSFFVGKGLGVFSRGGQEFSNYDILHGSTESFFIQLFVETGVIGFLIFVSLVIFSYFKLASIDKNLAYGLAAICVIGLFSPAPYGFVCGMLMYFCLASGVFLNLNVRE